MKIRGKRVERLNSYGDDLKISIKDDGKMRLSPVLVSRLQLGPDTNKIGFGYPEIETENVCIYKALDGDGVAVNKQGYIVNIPHNRDLRSYLNLPNTGEVEVIVTEEFESMDAYPGYKFHKVVTTNQQLAQETLEDLQQVVEKSGGEIVKTEETEEEIFGEDDQKFQEEVQEAEIVEEDEKEDSNTKTEDENEWFN